MEKTLQSLNKKLNLPMPSEKKNRKPQEVSKNLWNIHDVYAYQFHEEDAKKHGYGGKYILIQKIGEGIERFSGETMMRIHVLDRIFNEFPTIDDMVGVRILPLDSPSRVSINEDPIWMSAFMLLHRKSEYPAQHLTFIGNRQGVANRMTTNNRILTWSNIDTSLYKFHQRWYGIEYETVGEGVYKYYRSN